MNKHPHYDKLNALAEGKTIQFKHLGEDAFSWEDITEGKDDAMAALVKGEIHDLVFRIKPELREFWAVFP